MTPPRRILPAFGRWPLNGLRRGDKPKPAAPRSSPGPAKGTEGPPPDGPALAVGITEQNPNFFAVGDVAAEFSRWRDELVKIRPAYYRVVVDWSALQPA